MENDVPVRMLGELFSELCDPWPDACFLVNPTGEMVAVNQAGARILGGTCEELPGRLITDFVIYSAEMVLRHLVTCSKSRQQLPGILSLQGNDGREIKYRCYGHRIYRQPDAAPLVFLRCSPTQPASNKFTALNQQIEKQQAIQSQLLKERDQLQNEIAERKRADEVTKASNERLFTVLNGLDAIVYVADMKNYELLFVNTYVKERFGDIVGQPCWQGIQTGQSGPCNFCSNDKLIDASGNPTGVYCWEIQNTTNGRWYDVRDRAIQWADGRIVRLEIATDITERKQSEEDLRQALLLNQHIINSAQEGIVVHDRDFYYRVWNPFMEKITGKKSADVVGRLPQDVFPFLGEIGVLERLHKVIAGELVENIEIQFQRPDTGKTVWTSDICSPIRDSTGTIIGILQTVRDITEHRKTEMQFQQAQKMESVGRLAGGVAHDFNNMLTIITCNAQLALMKADQTNPLYHHLAEILNAAERSAEITRQLLTFSRQQTIEPKIIDLNDAISGMLKMLRRLIGEDIDLVWKPGFELLRIKIDSSQLDQIMANLCVNARDAISGVGKLDIKTENFTIDKTGWDKHTDVSPGEYVILSVTDNGSGIPKDAINHIFEPFFTTKELGKGTGLGLATVYGIVQQNGGQIKVYSEPGQGTIFRIYLPGVTDTVTGAIDKPAVIGGNETILLVEDELAIMNLGTNMLATLGYKVLSANSPGEAKQLADNNQGLIDLLVTDIIMPGMNGRDLSKILLLANPGMKCLFMSGYTADVLAGRGDIDKNMSFLQKPFNMDSLSAKVREALIARKA